MGDFTLRHKSKQTIAHLLLFYISVTTM